MCKSSVTYNLKGRIYIVDNDESITGSDELVSFEIKANAFTNNTFIGSVVTKSIEIELLNTANRRNLSGKTVKAFVSYNNEEIPFGTFKIEDKSDGDVKKQTTFVGYDLMNASKDKYIDTVVYPTTLAELLKSVCNEMGVELATPIFPNSTFIITGNPFTNGETNQIVLNSISQIAGGFAYIGRDDKLYIKNLELNNKVERIDPTVYFEDFTMKDYYSPINTVIVALPNVEGENITKRDDVYASIIEIKGNVDNYIALTGNCVLNVNNNQYPINLGSIELINALDKFNVEVSDGRLYKNIYEDKLYYQNSEWFLHKELNSKKFTGNENWIASSQGTIYKYSLTVNNLSTESKNIWSKQISTKLSDTDLDNYIYIENGNVCFTSTSIKTLSDFKKYIANKKVFYVLNTATTTSVATAYPSLYAQLLKLNTLELENGNNTLYLESENTVSSIIKLEYNDIYGKQIVEDEYINIDNVISAPNQEIKIEENYILTSDEDRRNIINELFNAVNGINYLPFSVSYYGFPYLDVGDNITVVDTERNEYNGYIFNLSFKYNGGFSGKIDSPKIDRIVEKIKNSTDLKTKFRNVELSVNKIEGKITSLIEEVDDVSSKTSSLEQTVDSISLKVDDLENLTNEVTGTDPITLTNCKAGDLLELHIKGNNNVFYHQYPNDELYPSDTLYPYKGSSALEINNEDLSSKLLYTSTIWKCCIDKVSPHPVINYSSCRSAFMSAEPNSTYRITKKAGARFALGSFTIDNYSDIMTGLIPTNYVSDENEGEGLTELSITTGKEDHSILIFFWDGNIDTITQWEMLATIHIQKDYAKYELNVLNTLKKSGDYYDEYVIKGGYGYELRRILDNGIIVENPEPTNKIPLSIPLREGTNTIDIVDYTATVTAKYVIKSDLTNFFATQIELSSQILQTSNEIKLSVMEEVTDENYLKRATIESSIDLGILDDQGYIHMKTNKFSWESDNSSLTQDGELTITKANIGNWRLTNNKFAYFVQYTGDSNKYPVVGIDTEWIDDPEGSVCFFAGADRNINTAPFRVYTNGTVSLRRVEIWDADSGGDPGYITLYNAAGRVGTTIDTTSIESYNIYAATGGKLGQVMHGIDGSRTGHLYGCYWNGSQLEFFIDHNNISAHTRQCWINSGTSDKRLKHDIGEVEEDILNIIEELEIKSFILNVDKNNKIRFGIIAQDLIEISEKYAEIDIFKYFIINKENDGYYSIEYEQVSMLKIACLERKLKAQEKKINKLLEKMEEN